MINIVYLIFLFYNSTGIKYLRPMLEVFAGKLIATYLRGMQIEVHRKLIIEKSKKIFFRKIGFESLISHGSALSFKISRVAPVERKSIFTILSCFKRKIF